MTEFLTEFDFENDTINSYINHKKDHDLQVFLVGLRNFFIRFQLYLFMATNFH